MALFMVVDGEDIVRLLDVEMKLQSSIEVNAMRREMETRRTLLRDIMRGFLGRGDRGIYVLDLGLPCLGTCGRE
jgi:hypothetical protein